MRVQKSLSVNEMVKCLKSEADVAAMNIEQWQEQVEWGMREARVTVEQLRRLQEDIIGVKSEE